MTFETHALASHMLEALLIVVLFYALTSLFFYSLDSTKPHIRKSKTHTMSVQNQLQPQPGSATSWLQAIFTSLYESSPPTSGVETDFKALFFSAFSEDATIVRNHENIKVEELLNGVMGSGAGVGIVGSRVEWKDIMEVPVDGDSKAVIVAGFFVVTRSSKIRIRAGPMQRLSYNSFSARIDSDAEAVPNIEGSQRRIMQLFITTVDKTPPIHLPSIPKKEEEEDKTIDPRLLGKK